MIAKEIEVLYRTIDSRGYATRDEWDGIKLLIGTLKQAWEEYNVRKG